VDVTKLQHLLGANFEELGAAGVLGGAQLLEARVHLVQHVVVHHRADAAAAREHSLRGGAQQTYPKITFASSPIRQRAAIVMRFKAAQRRRGTRV